MGDVFVAHGNKNKNNKKQQQNHVIPQVNNKEVKLLKIRVSEPDSWDREGKNFSEIFTIKKDVKQEDALYSFFFNFPSEYAFRKVQTNQEGLKFNGTHQSLGYADDVIILGGNIHPTNKISKL